MTRYLTFWALVLLTLVGVQSARADVVAGPVAATADTLFISLPGNRLDVFPMELVKSFVEGGEQKVVTTIDGKQYTYDASTVLSVSHTGPKQKPFLTSFKFNNKFNGQLYTDVVCEFGAKGLITGSVVAIGKWLAPSFQLSDKTAEVYVGRKLQHSKETRLSFAEPVEYVVTRPGWQVMTLSTPEVDDDDDEEPVVPDPLPNEVDENAVKVTLTGDMLSTNAPTTLSNEDLPMIIDGDDYTYFHSTWTGAGYPVLPLDSCPWIEVTLPDPIHNLQFRYETRSADNRWPLGMRVDVSKDGETWTQVRNFTEETDGLPAASLQWWTSPVLDLKGDYKHFRFVCTAAAYKNYLCLAELEIYSVPSTGGGDNPDPTPDPNPTLSDGSTLDFQPYGTKYTVSIDWPTDRAVDVPSIYITTETGQVPTSKSEYIDGTFSIDGAGVFPDMDETPMQIKGRGNSSWSTPSLGGWWSNSPKNPYRLKFETSIKPFGMTKGKSWVLLANKISGSMMTNAIGMKVAQLAGAAGANHIVPVNLYINGEYRGSYNFTEKIGFHNNSIDLDDESLATLLELDTYTDETIYHAINYGIPVKIHEPDFEDDETVTTLHDYDVMNDFDDMVEAVTYGEDVSRYVQVDTFAAFFLTNDYIMNQELFHPKSTYLYKERVGDPKDLWKFGPVWDLDWGFGHEMNGGYFTTGATSDYLTAKSMECNSFWKDLLKAGESIDRAYYKAWTRFLRLGAVEELRDFCQEYYEYASPSFTENASVWGDGYNYGSQISQQQSWLKRRAEYIYRRLTAYDLSDDLPEDEEWKPYTEGGTEEPVELDKTPYIRVRTAVENLLATTDSYVCLPTTTTALRNAVLLQNRVVENAETTDDVDDAIFDLRAEVVAFLSAKDLTIKEPLDLTNILINNPSPVENINGWDYTEMPNAFDPKTHTAEFLDQPEAEISQKVQLPAGDYQWTAIAMTRSGYTAQLFVDYTNKRLTTASSKTVNSRAEARAWFDTGKGVNTITFSLDDPAVKELGLRADANNGDHWLVWSDFKLIMTGKKSVPIVSDDQYLAARQTIADGKHYRILTHFNGTTFTSTPYYLSRDGHLTATATDDDVFVFTVTEGNAGTGNTDLYVTPGWRTDAYFTNPTLSDESQGDLVPRGYISVNTKLARDNWEGQVWYKDGDRYAVRATNAPGGSWGAETYWTVLDVNGDKQPDADYSWDPCFYWELEEVPVANTFTLTYLVDGEIYKVQAVEVGTPITPEAEPQKEGYTFSGWSEVPGTMPDHDLNVTGTFTVNTYVIRYYVGDQLIAEDKVEYGAKVELRDYTPDDPARYTFVGWDGRTYETMPAHDIEYHATISDGILSLEDLRGVVAIYDVAGRKLSRLQRGVNVLRLTDGTTRTLIVK